MNEKEFKDLLEKYREGNCTEREKIQLESWLTFGQFSGSTFSDAQVDARLDQLATRLPLYRKSVSLWPRLFGLAAAVALIVIGVYFFNAPNPVELVSGSSDIKAGKNIATLTLANGKTISLSSAKTGVVIDAGKLTYNDGTEIPSDLTQPRNSRHMMTISTPRGGTYQVILPDGSHVWLNSASILRFPSSFAGSLKRRVTLEGEGYFEISKVYTSSLQGSNSSLAGGAPKPSRVPFLVETKGQQVEVLGTHFNINSYADQTSTKTTLLEGRVRIVLRAASDGFKVLPSAILEPNQQAILTNSTIKVVEVDPTDVMDWKNGDFIFKNESLTMIMKRIARWYNVEVVYESGVDRNQTFGGKVSRQKNISEVLNIMASTGMVTFKVEGRNVTIMK